jgi:hypothetical protein
MSYYMKKPCEKCPFRTDVKPFLTPERGEELAYHAQNPYNSFVCHKTLEYIECDDDIESDRLVVTGRSKECAGFITLQINEGARTPEGFTPDFENIYNDSWEMASAYEEFNQ